MRVFKKICPLACVWLCCCFMACDPYFEVDYSLGYVKALKPAGVDSLEMRVYSNDSLVATDYSRSSENGAEVAFAYENYCDSKEYANKNWDFTIAISFFCGEKKVDLPTYMVKVKTNRIGFVDERVTYYIAEFDERKVNGNYSLETFLAPEDTACGKFVNYAVLKVE